MKLRFKCLGVEMQPDSTWSVRLCPEKDTDHAQTFTVKVTDPKVWFVPGHVYIVEFTDTEK